MKQGWGYADVSQSLTMLRNTIGKPHCGFWCEHENRDVTNGLAHGKETTMSLAEIVVQTLIYVLWIVFGRTNGGQEVTRFLRE